MCRVGRKGLLWGLEDTFQGRKIWFEFDPEEDSGKEMELNPVDEGGMRRGESAEAEKRFG